MNPELTKEQIEFIKDNLTRKTFKQIMAILPHWSENITQSSYRVFIKKCKKVGLRRDKIKDKVPYKGTYNQQYWKELNLVKCYLGGNLAADGCIMHKKNSKLLILSVSTKDEGLLDSYIKELNFKGTKIKGISKGKFCQEGGSPYCRIMLTSFDDNAKYLKEHFNLEPQKTKRMGPTNIKNDYYNLAYLMGYIDGDGTISLSHTQKGKFKTITLSLLSCSKPLMEWFVNLINEKIPVVRRKAELRYRERSHTWEYSIGGLRAAVAIDYLRQLPLENIRLKRKWDNPEILEWINKRKEKFPESFIKISETELAALMPHSKPEEYQLLPQISLPPL